MKTACIVTTGANQVEFKECEIRDPAPGELLVETLYSAVSPGTELRCMAGKEANSGPFPMITGYSLVGKVLNTADSFQTGDYVFVPGSFVMPDGISRAWGGHIKQAVVPSVWALKLATETDLQCASALAMLSIALHGVAKSCPAVGDDVMVVGLGLIGQLAVALYRLAGCRVAVCDPVGARRAIAAPDGGYSYIPDANWHEDVYSEFPKGFDMLVDATGIPAVVSANTRLLRQKSWENPYEPSPKLVLLASYSGAISVDYQETLFNKEAQIVACRNYLPCDLWRAARLVETKAVDMSRFLGHIVKPSKGAEAFQQLREHPDLCLTVVFDWQ